MISPKQSGFRKHHSCQSLLLKITDYLLQSMDQGQISGLTSINLRKAFDLVDHTTLLQKLQLYGLNEDAVTWFRSSVIGSFKTLLITSFQPKQI